MACSDIVFYVYIYSIPTYSGCVNSHAQFFLLQLYINLCILNFYIRIFYCICLATTYQLNNDLKHVETIIHHNSSNTQVLQSKLHLTIEYQTDLLLFTDMYEKNTSCSIYSIFCININNINWWYQKINFKSIPGTLDS